MNDEGNNFSTIRNAEINRIGPVYISPMFYEKYGVHDKMKQLDAYENPIYITHHSDIWKRGPEYQHKRMNSTQKTGECRGKGERRRVCAKDAEMQEVPRYSPRKPSYSRWSGYGRKRKIYFEIEEVNFEWLDLV